MEQGRDFFVDSVAEAVAQRLEHMQGQRRRLLNVEQAAEYLGTTENGIYHLVSQGKLTRVRYDRLLKFDVRDLDRFIEQNKRKS